MWGDNKKKNGKGGNQAVYVPEGEMGYWVSPVTRDRPIRAGYFSCGSFPVSPPTNLPSTSLLIRLASAIT